MASVAAPSGPAGKQPASKLAAAMAAVALQVMAAVPLQAMAPVPLQAMADVPLQVMAAVPLQAMAAVPLQAMAAVALQVAAAVPLQAMADLDLADLAPLAPERRSPMYGLRGRARLHRLDAWAARASPPPSLLLQPGFLARASWRQMFRSQNGYGNRGSKGLHAEGAGEATRVGKTTHYH